MTFPAIESSMYPDDEMVVTPLRMPSRKVRTLSKSLEDVVFGSSWRAISASGTTSSAPSRRLVRPWLTYFVSRL